MATDNATAAGFACRSSTVDQDVATRKLFDSLYPDLHSVARRELYRRGAFSILGATTILHEAYVKVSEGSGAVFGDHARFLGYAARVMGTLIIDEVRRRRSHKRGGRFHLTALEEHHADRVPERRSRPELRDALDRLAEVEPEVAEIIELKFFGGFSFAEIGAMRGVSARTIQRSWDRGRLYLHKSMAVDDLRE